MLKPDSVLRRFLSVTGLFILLITLAFSFLAVAAVSAAVLVEYFEIEVVGPPDSGIGLIMFMISLIFGLTSCAATDTNPHENFFGFAYQTVCIGGLFSWGSLIGRRAIAVSGGIKPAFVGIEAAISDEPYILTITALTLWSLLLLTVAYGWRRIFRHRETTPC